MTAQASSPSATESPALDLQGLGKRFGRHWAVAHVDLELPRGSSLLLVGANGSGKTTLLRMVAGLIRPSAGRMCILGLDGLQARAQIRQSLSLVSHRTYLYESLTAREHVQLWRRLRDPSGPAARMSPASDDELLDTVGLVSRADDRAGTFSAGMRKRLTLVRAHLEAPDLLLLDEPFAALDPAGQEWMTEWLGHYTSSGRTLVLASHALERARPICSSSVVMQRGQIIWRGPADQVQSELLEPAAQITQAEDR